MSSRFKNYEEIDWELVDKRLSVYARYLAGAANLLFDHGISAEDLVGETWQQFFESPNKLGWNAKRGKIEPFLKTVLFRRYVDHIRREGKVLVEWEEDRISSQQSEGPDPYDEAVVEELQLRMLERIEGRDDEEELADFILAATQITGGGQVNKELAARLGVGTKEIVNRRKRLIRVLGEVYETWKGTGKKSGGSGEGD